MSEPTDWAPPEPTGGSVIWTRTWRFLTYEAATTPTVRLYVALTHEWLTEAYEALFPFLDGERISHRHARSPEALRKAEAHPGWAGKALVIDTAETALDRLAAELDGRLAGKGVSGPSMLTGARSFGGSSGLIFIRRTADSAGQDDRRERLAKLLGD